MKNNNPKGSALVAALMVVTVLLVLATGLLTSVILEYKTARNDYQDKQAFYLAEAGIFHAKEYLTTVTWTTLSTGQTLISTTTIGQGNYKVTVYYYNAADPRKITIRSVGKVNKVVKEIEATLERL